MKSKETVIAVVLLVLLVAVGYGIISTQREGPPHGRRAAADTSAIAIDQSSLTTAEALVALTLTDRERPYAEDALRLGDQEMDLSFADAVRRADTAPRTLSKEAQTVQVRLQGAERELADDQAELARLTAAVAKAGPAHAGELNDQVDLAKAHVALHQDEVDDAKADLIRAGGDPKGRVEAMIREHETSSKHSDSVHVVTVATADAPGLIHHAAAWWAVRDKDSKLAQARADADSAAGKFAGRHDTLEVRTAHDDSAGEAGRGSPTAAHAGGATPPPLSHEASAALLRAAQQRATQNKTLAGLDQHTDNQRRLSATYTQWSAIVERQQRAILNRALRALALILIIVLVGLLVDQRIEHVLAGTAMDRRRLQTLYMVVRVSIQVIGALFVLLVVFGPPNNLGTFIGLAGAGLTVALKDFILGFVGWFVLMGKDGIRIGDLVEINEVTGEVIEMGLFHTVMLETGSWSDAGHPTGRRVTFSNSFAIEGHYFNFSTSGQWLWDDIHLVVPNGRDPYPIVDALKHQVEEATAESASAAEQHWRGSARRSPNLSALTAAPAFNVKPVVGGTDITIRYVTHVSQRAELRASLYHTAVELLGERHPAPPPAPTVGASGPA